MAVSSSSAPSLLVVGPSWVGDMVLAQSLFLVLRQKLGEEFPLRVLAPSWSLPLLARMPQVTGALEMPLGHGRFAFSTRRDLGRQLGSYAFDQAIVLPNSWKSALIPYFARIPKRTGYVGEFRFGLLNDPRRLDKKRLPKTVERFVALGLDPGDPLPDPLPRPGLIPSPSGVEAALHRLGLDPGKVLALCPGAEYGPAKQWPPSSYAAVARVALERGVAVWIFGSEKDRQVGEDVVRLAPGAVNLAGQTALAEAIDLLSLASVVVTNDSGLMHVASALDRPLIALFGSSDPHFTPPMNPAARIHTLGLACSPCFKRTCPLGHTRCLVDLPIAPVIAAMEGFLA